MEEEVTEEKTGAQEDGGEETGHWADQGRYISHLRLRKTSTSKKDYKFGTLLVGEGFMLDL